MDVVTIYRSRPVAFARESRKNGRAIAFSVGIGAMGSSSAINFRRLAEGTARDEFSDEGAHSGPPVVTGEEDHGGMDTRVTIGGGIVDESDQRATEVAISGDIKTRTEIDEVVYD